MSNSDVLTPPDSTPSAETAFQVAAFYHFGTVDDVEATALKLEAHGDACGLRGLIIFAAEGINGTISGPTREGIISYLAWVSELLSFPELKCKFSAAPAWPFRKFKVRVREEIVTLGKPEVQPYPERSPTHLSPAEWDRVMSEEDVLVLDTRNWYETRIGKFEGAIDPQLGEFNEFSDYLRSSEFPKEKKILIYCTGGIRCEKAVVEMNNQGFNNVFQLDGGIINYLAQYPNRKFEGECFVFDYRVALTQELKPTRLYQLCPHCGQPADQIFPCKRCDTEVAICITCYEDKSMHVCSKNCAYHYAVAPEKKGRSQKQGPRYTLRPPALQVHGKGQA